MTSAAEERPPGLLHSPWLRLRNLVLIFLVLVLGLIGAVLWYFNSSIGSIHRESLLPTEHGRAGKGENFLFLGSDSRTGELRQSSRSDVIQVVHLSADRRSAIVIHFPRDLFVPIPGHGKNKINAAYAFGGAPLLVRTIQDYAQINISHVIQTGFEGFAKVTDVVGGVTVNATQSSSEGGLVVHVGPNTLNGTQALAYVRERHQLKLGDIDRGKRQQQWMQGIVRKVVSPGVAFNPIKAIRLVRSVLPYLVVDDTLSNGDIRSLIFSSRNMRPGAIVYLTAPWTTFGRDASAGSIVVPDLPEMARMSEALRGDDLGVLRSMQGSGS